MGILLIILTLAVIIGAVGSFGVGLFILSVVIFAFIFHNIGWKPKKKGENIWHDILGTSTDKY